MKEFQDKKKDASKIRCYNYQKLGHFSYREKEEKASGSYSKKKRDFFPRRKL
jgi:hypothetical protein